ncbi:thioredoxin domain-containing protein [Flavobacterium sp. Root420]|uniref:thioredoxin domain-containing protein n=1 Tax=Flavobacterium sp. Root420 TaxID=1736533 RepID=UPI0006FD5C3A|nr:thioredoxin domain-containing protein [Flavobacterium sp. Root420]KQX10212.1 hypothetical protein ASC72_21255 [Flavobacterium sp. Root420]
MSENFTYLFRYLEAEQINVSKSEFQFQIQSHPHYPSLVSVTDTLSFFNIVNIVLSIEVDEKELLPDTFVILLEIENNQPHFYFVKKKGDVYFCLREKNEIILSKPELILKWKKIVLLVEKSEKNIIKYANTSKRFWTLCSICIIFFLLSLMQFNINIITYFFFAFPILGTLLSIIILKDLFGIESELLNRLCTVNNITNCSTVVNSNKWKVFEVVNFSDLSLIFFITQFFSLYIFLLTNDISTYFNIQKTILICTFPVLLISIYYQKVIVKKWCPLCLSIIALILFESLYLTILTQSFYKFQTRLLIQYGFIISVSIFSWFLLKKTLKNQKEIKELNITTNRFIRNYEMFKNNLLASTQVKSSQIPLQETIILGNPDASLKIKFITSPFCSFCAEALAVIKEIVSKYPNKVCIDVHFNFDEIGSDEKSKRIHQQLVSIYYDHGQILFIKALYKWYKYKDESIIYKIISEEVKESDEFNNKSHIFLKEIKPNIIKKVISKEEKSTLILRKQFHWNRQNFINFTPAIIINGYFLPKYYDKNNLIHFINDLSEDEDF